MPSTAFSAMRSSIHTGIRMNSQVMWGRVASSRPSRIDTRAAATVTWLAVTPRS
ncbi:hypothetical protein D3C78_1883280 [compost metagenome]